MNGPEIHPAVDAGKIRARAKAEAWHEGVDKALKSANALAAQYEKEDRRRANRALLLRAALVAAWVAGIWTAWGFDYISVQLAVVLESAGLIWLAVWLGAWMQYRFCKAGVLR